MTEANECKVYVGNLPFSVGFAELKELFSPYGEVTEATVIVNHYTGRSKGFGFVTFAKKEDAEKAIKEMDKKDVKGRSLKVNVAMPPEDKAPKKTEETKPEEVNSRENSEKKE